MRGLFILALLVVGVFAGGSYHGAALKEAISRVQDQVVTPMTEESTEELAAADADLEDDQAESEEAEQMLSDLDEDLTACISAGIAPAIPASSPAFKLASGVFERNKAIRLAFEGNRKKFLDWVKSGKGNGIEVEKGGKVLKVVTWFKRSKVASTACIRKKKPVCKKIVAVKKKAIKLAKTGIKKLIKSGCGAGEAKMLKRLGKSVVNKLAKADSKVDHKLAKSVQQDLRKIKAISTKAANKSSSLQRAIKAEQKVKKMDKKLILAAEKKAAQSKTGSSVRKEDKALKRKEKQVARQTKQILKQEQKVKKQDQKKILRSEKKASALLKNAEKNVSKELHTVAKDAAGKKKTTNKKKRFHHFSPRDSDAALRAAIAAAVRAAAAKDHREVAAAERKSEAVRRLAHKVEAEARAAVSRYHKVHEREQFASSVFHVVRHAVHTAPDAPDNSALHRKQWREVFVHTIHAIKRGLLHARKIFGKGTQNKAEDAKRFSGLVHTYWHRAVRFSVRHAVKQGVPHHLAFRAARSASRHLKHLLQVENARRKRLLSSKKKLQGQSVGVNKKSKVWHAVYKSTKRAIHRAYLHAKSKLTLGRNARKLFREQVKAGWKRAIKDSIKRAVKNGVSLAVATSAAHAAAKDLHAKIVAMRRKAVLQEESGDLASEAAVKAVVQKKLDALASQGEAALAKYADEMKTRLAEQELARQTHEAALSFENGTNPAKMEEEDDVEEQEQQQDDEEEEEDYN